MLGPFKNLVEHRKVKTMHVTPKYLLVKLVIAGGESGLSGGSVGGESGPCGGAVGVAHRTWSTTVITISSRRWPLMMGPPVMVTILTDLSPEVSLKGISMYVCDLHQSSRHKSP